MKDDKFRKALRDSALQLIGSECPGEDSHFLADGFMPRVRGGRYHVGCYLCGGIAEIDHAELRRVARAYRKTGTLPRVHWAMTSLPQSYVDSTVREMAS